MVNMSDIADACGVSRTVVSLVLNGKSEKIGISERTKEQVLEISRQLGYCRDEVAVSMASRQRNIIAFVSEPMGDIAYTGRILNGVIDAVSAQGLSLMTQRMNEGNHDEVLRKLIGWRCAGVVFHISEVSHIADMVEELKENGIPYSMVNLYNPEGLGITSNDRLGIKNMVKTMKSCGSLRPALLSSQSHGIYLEERLQGYLSGMEEYYPGLEPEVIRAATKIMDLPRELPGELKARGIDAVLCVADDQAVRFMTLAMQQGYRIPEDFMISGFGGMIDAEMTEPSLASVVQDFERMGQGAVELLLSGKRKKNILLPVSQRKGMSISGKRKKASKIAKK